MSEQLSKYKPGRRLDAMVAMCLGWKWRRDDDEFRFLWKEGERHRLTAANKEDPIWDQDCCGAPSYSTNDGAAFEAALQAGVPDVLNFKKSESLRSAGDWVIEPRTGIIAGHIPPVDTAAHCLCLGILAIQTAEKLAEYESWLPEEVE